MNLRQTRDSNRFRVERAEEERHRRARLGEEERLELVEGRREALVLKGLHRLRPGEGDELDGREVLAELRAVLAVSESRWGWSGAAAP